MVWYEDINLVAWFVLNIVTGLLGVVRRGIVWPLVGFFILFVGYNYLTNAGYDVLAVTVFFLLLHVASLVSVVKSLG